ncbi:MAG: Rpn family recombination-promoting nuclease/putative transposase, partial [Natronospirillum sp.]
MAKTTKPPHNPHDRFFRNAMENKAVAQGFMQYYLPSHIRDALDLDSLSLEHDSYLDPALRETVSDLVYRCQLAGEPAYLALLVEHQSTPDPHMPVRIGHYLFSLLTKHLKLKPNEPLAPVHALVFYHGSQTPYPYSMSLADCFKDPLGLMKTLFLQPIPLVDINQLSDEELKQQQWVGIVARVLKHIREPHIDTYLLEWLFDCATLGNQSHQQLDFIRTLLNYVTRTGNVIDIDHLVEESHRLPKPIGETFMTIAEQLEARGIAKGEAKGEAKGKAEGKVEGITETALNLLKEGTNPQFVAKVTGLSLEDVMKL